MNNKLEKTYRIPVSQSDNLFRLSIPGTFAVFMDLASEHGSDIGMGMDDLAKHGLIWLAVKTKIRFYKRPATFENVTLATWPGEPGRARCDRYYTMTDGENLLIEAKNEWAMLEPATGRLRRIKDAYPEDLVHLEDKVCDYPYHKVSDDFENCEEIGTYTVSSSDIDTSQHMNNVQYVRAVFGALSSEELEKMNITEVEVAYKLQCYEGEKLSFRKRKSESGTDIGVIKEDGKTATTVRIICE
ncbi:MAG: hypothetical protein IJD80_04015 [Oscillospiraceae bacterium]|nr:hypothetical protein [Oscillospiraceae bacterium]